MLGLVEEVEENEKRIGKELEEADEGVGEMGALRGLRIFCDNLEEMREGVRQLEMKTEKVMKEVPELLGGMNGN